MLMQQQLDLIAGLVPDAVTGMVSSCTCVQEINFKRLVVGEK